MHQVQPGPHRSRPGVERAGSRPPILCQARFFSAQSTSRGASRKPLSPRRSLPLPLPEEAEVKFLCDRCKTRYSIGDARVRGKILKIRCKNCANVITVREGMMADPDGSQPSAPEYPARAKKTTTIAPAAMGEGSEAAKAAIDLANLVKDRGAAGR